MISPDADFAIGSWEQENGVSLIVRNAIRSIKLVRTASALNTAP
jgi:hypothetical protein